MHYTADVLASTPQVTAKKALAGTYQLMYSACWCFAHTQVSLLTILCPLFIYAFAYLLKTNLFLEFTQLALLGELLQPCNL